MVLCVVLRLLTLPTRSLTCLKRVLSCPSPTRPRRQTYPAPRLWLMRFMLLLLLIMLLGLGWYGWQERERLNTELQQVTGEMSNLHARFDAEEGRGQHVSSFGSRLATVEEHNESIVARLAGLEVEVQQSSEREASRFTALDERVDEVVGNLDGLLDDVEAREALLGAVRSSLDSLERVESEGREGLEAQIAALETSRERDAQQFETLQESHAALVERYQDTQASFEDQLSGLDERLQALDAEHARRFADVENGLAGSTAMDAALEEVTALQSRLSALETELRELRQEQLRLNAGLQALQ